MFFETSEQVALVSMAVSLNILELSFLVHVCLSLVFYRATCALHKSTVQQAVVQLQALAAPSELYCIPRAGHVAYRGLRGGGGISFPRIAAHNLLHPLSREISGILLVTLGPEVLVCSSAPLLLSDQEVRAIHLPVLQCRTASTLSRLLIGLFTLQPLNKPVTVGTWLVFFVRAASPAYLSGRKQFGCVAAA